MTPEQYTRLVNHESGLLGVSETSSSMKVLLEEESTNPHAAEAIALFVYQLQKAVGALSATIGGLDSLVFSGGIGEQSAVIRERVCDGLGYLGINLDVDRNSTNQELISSTSSQVGVHVLPTDEAQVLAAKTVKIMQNIQRGA